MKYISIILTPFTIIPALFLVLAVLPATQGAAPGQRNAPPDLPQGGKPDDTHDWTLGPTG